MRVKERERERGAGGSVCERSLEIQLYNVRILRGKNMDHNGDAYRADKDVMHFIG